MWLLAVPIIFAGSIMTIKDLVDPSMSGTENLFWEGIALGISGFGFTALIIRKEFYQMYISKFSFRVAHVEGIIPVIFGWLGLLFCWLNSFNSFIHLLMLLKP